MELPAKDDDLKRRYDLVTLIAALAVGVGSVWAVTRLYGQGAAPPAQEEVAVLVAARDLHAGEVVTAEAIKVGSYPKQAVTAATALPGDRAALVDLPLRVDLRAGTPLLRSYVSRPAIDERLSSRLRPGERAVAVAVDAVSTLGGHLEPNDRVDVLATFRINGADPSRTPRTRTILTGIPVLAVGTRTGTSLRRGSFADLTATGRSRPDAGRATTVTLRVTPPQAEVLVLAGATADLSLILRNPDDADTTGTDGDLTLGELLHLQASKSKRPAAPPRPKQPPVTYER